MYIYIYTRIFYKSHASRSFRGRQRLTAAIVHYYYYYGAVYTLALVYDVLINNAKTSGNLKHNNVM